MAKESISQFGVILDMDGVIVDSNPVHKKAWMRFLSEQNKSLSDEEFQRKIFGRTNQDWLREMFPEAGERRLNQLIDEKERLFRKMYAETIALVPGLQKFLDSLEFHSVPMGVATSAPQANVDWVLQTTDLTGYFNVILTAKDVDQGKPHPEIYLKTAEALEKEPTSCVVFEDSLAGIESAKRADAFVVGVSTTHSADEMNGADMVVQDFTGLDYILLTSLVEEKRKTA